jgi:hypothetical protein
MEPFSYHGWNFLCASVPDADHHFWSVVLCELSWPGGLPVVLCNPKPDASTEAAAEHARLRAMSWVDERTIAVNDEV